MPEETELRKGVGLDSHADLVPTPQVYLTYQKKPAVRFASLFGRAGPGQAGFYFIFGEKQLALTREIPFDREPR